MSTQTSEEVGAREYLEQALEDLDQARKTATEELRSTIDAAISRSREALDHLRSDAEERGEHLKARAEERLSEWQHTLEEATEDARREFGLRSVRAQRSKDALEAMSDEISEHKKELAE
jgi:uncharacterized protein YicC (UPF0701 family)